MNDLDEFAKDIVSEKEMVSSTIHISDDDGKSWTFKMPIFYYSAFFIEKDGYIHGQVFNDNQCVWKEKKWNKETGKVFGGGNATYFDLVPVKVNTFDFSIGVKEQPKQVSEDAFTVTETTSDGGSNSFYIFDDYVCDVDSLCRYWNLSSAEGNILKSLTANIGSRHGGTNKKREVRKSLHYAIERMRWNDFSDEEIMAQVKRHFKN